MTWDAGEPGRVQAATVPCAYCAEPVAEPTAHQRDDGQWECVDRPAFDWPTSATSGPVLSHDPNEDDRVKTEVGECLYAGDHEDVGGVCVHCGAEFDQPEDDDA